MKNYEKLDKKYQFAVVEKESRENINWIERIKAERGSEWKEYGRN